MHLTPHPVAAPPSSVMQLGYGAASAGGELARFEPGVPADVREQVAFALGEVHPEDVRLLRERGISIDVLDASRLPGTDHLGATEIEQSPAGMWEARRIRIAGRAEQETASIAEIVWHEVGHALAVERGQDRSEAAAEAYIEARIAHLATGGTVSEPAPAGSATSGWAGAAVAMALLGVALLFL